MCVAANGTAMWWNSKRCLIACSVAITAPSQSDRVGEVYLIPLLLNQCAVGA